MSATKTNNGSRAKQVSKDAQAVEAIFKTKPCRTYANKGKCRYQFMCTYAHGQGELRTKEMNIRDDITTTEKVKQFQKRLETAYYTRSKAASRTARRQEERAASTLPSVPSTPGSLSPMHLSPRHQSSGHSGFGSPGALFPNFSSSSRTASMISSRSFASSSPSTSYWLSTTTEPPVRLGALQSPTPAMQPDSGHVPRCECRECLLATAQAAEAQAVACPCPECLAATAAAVAALTTCRIVAARKAQAQVQVCPCLECLAAAQAALAAAANPCPCNECNAGEDRSAGDRTTSAVSPSSASPGVSDGDYLELR